MLSVAVRGLGGSALVLFGDEQAAGGGTAQNGRLAGGGGRVRDAADWLEYGEHPWYVGMMMIVVAMDGQDRLNLQDSELTTR